MVEGTKVEKVKMAPTATVAGVTSETNMVATIAGDATPVSDRSASVKTTRAPGDMAVAGASLKDRVGDRMPGESAGKAAEEDRELAMIRAEIAQARMETRETVNAIQHQLAPERIAALAAEKVREMTMDKARSMTQSAETRIREMGETMYDTIRDNLIPTVMITAGVAWLIKESRETNGKSHDWKASPDHPAYSYPEFHEWQDAPDDQFRPRNAYPGEPIPPGERMGDGRGHGTDEKSSLDFSRAGEAMASAASFARDKSGDLGRQVRRGYRGARRGFFDQLQDNPLAVAGVAMIAGALLGLSVPETHQEEEWMGPYRDRMMEAAEERGRDTLRRAESVASHAARAAYDTAREDVRDQGLAPGAAMA